MLIERQVKSFSPQNTAGVSQEKGITVIFQTIETNGYQVSNVKNKQPNKQTKNLKCLHAAHLR